MKVGSQSTWVNPGGNYVAYCNLPGLGALDIVSNLEVMWFHNSQQLTNMCQFLLSVPDQRYICTVQSPQMNNISFELTVTSKCLEVLKLDPIHALKRGSSQVLKDQSIWMSFDRSFNYLYHITFPD